jgi:hypothetical protein
VLPNLVHSEVCQSTLKAKQLIVRVSVSVRVSVGVSVLVLGFRVRDRISVT